MKSAPQPANHWLPPLITLADHGGDWHGYLDAIYTRFIDDFVRRKPTFPGKLIGLNRHPVRDNKEATFWHFVSEGSVEEDRTPDFRRCERIAWPFPIIEALARCQQPDAPIRCWTQLRGKAKRILIALADFSYVVILDDRGDYVLPWTAYCVEHRHQREKCEREWTAAQARQKAGAAPWEDGPVTPATPGS